MTQVEIRQEAFALEELPSSKRAVVAEVTRAIENLIRQTSASTIQVGKELLELRKNLSKAQFNYWVLANFFWKENVAERLMCAAEKSENNLFQVFVPIEVLNLLSSPHTPREAREEITRLVERNTPPTFKEAKSIMAKFTRKSIAIDDKTEIIERKKENTETIAEAACRITATYTPTEIGKLLESLITAADFSLPVCKVVWSEEEKEILRLNYNNTKVKELVKLLSRRNIKSIQIEVSKLGLRKKTCGRKKGCTYGRGKEGNGN